VNPSRAPFVMGGRRPTGRGLSGFRNYGRLELQPQAQKTVRWMLNSGELAARVRDVRAGRGKDLFQE